MADFTKLKLTELRKLYKTNGLDAVYGKAYKFKKQELVTKLTEALKKSKSPSPEPTPAPTPVPSREPSPEPEILPTSPLSLEPVTVNEAKIIIDNTTEDDIKKEVKKIIKKKHRRMPYKHY